MKKFVLYILMLPCLWTSCMEDKGIYTYVDINNIEVDTILSQTVQIYDTLRLTAKANCSLDSSNLEYVWYRYTGVHLQVDTLSMGKQLEWRVNLGIGTYDIYVKVTDLNSGLSGKMKFRVFVVGKFGKGLAVLGNVNGQTNLVFINEAGNATEIYNPENSAELGTNPVQIAGTDTKEVIVLCNDGRGGGVLKEEDFTLSSDFNSLFYSSPDIIAPQAFYCVQKSGMSQLIHYIINGGKLYNRLTSASRLQFEAAVPGDYELSPYAIANGFCCIFYDNKNECFYASKVQLGWVLATFAAIPSGTEGFDPSNIGMKLIYMSEKKGYNWDRRAFGLFKDGGQLVGMRFTLAEYSNMTAERSMKLMAKTSVPSTAIGIEDATGYAMSIEQPFLFYSYGSKIYQYEVESNMCFPIYDVDTVISNSVIDHIYMQRRDTPNGFGSDDPTLNRTLYVAVSERDKAGKNGSVMILNLKANGTFEKRAALYRNVCRGRTVSMFYKR